MFPFINVSFNSNAEQHKLKILSPFSTTAIFIYTIQDKGKIRKRNYRKRNDRNYITICIIFESVGGCLLYKKRNEGNKQYLTLSKLIKQKMKTGGYITIKYFQKSVKNDIGYN